MLVLTVDDLASDTDPPGQIVVAINPSKVQSVYPHPDADGFVRIELDSGHLHAAGTVEEWAARIDAAAE